jgi:hypothetical protein
MRTSIPVAMAIAADCAAARLANARMKRQAGRFARRPREAVERVIDACPQLQE